MSRAITFRFGESAGFRIVMEQGLNSEACADIKSDVGSIAASEIKANMEALRVRESQVDFVLNPIEVKWADGFPQIRYAKEGVMTFIEIVIPESSNNADHDIQHAAVDHNILEASDIHAVNAASAREDAVDFGNVSFEVPELMEFSLEPGLRDAIKSLEAGGKDFSLEALEGAFDVPKSLPAHNDMMDFRDIMSEIRKRESEKVRIKAKAKSN